MACIDAIVLTMIPVEEYLNGSYDPDVEYIDGVLVERNVGDWPPKTKYLLDAANIALTREEIFRS